MVEKDLLRDSTISPQCKTLYALLITYGPQNIFPGQQTLGDCLGTSRQTVSKWLGELRDRGLIDWDNRNGTSNKYYILGYDHLQPVKQALHPCKPGFTPPVNQALHDLESPIHNQYQENTPAASSLLVESEPSPNDQAKDESFYLPGEVPTAPPVPRTAEEHKAGIRRALETFSRNGDGRAGVADPTHESNRWIAVLDAFFLWFKPGLNDSKHLSPKTRNDDAQYIRELAEAGADYIGLDDAALAERALAIMEPLAAMETWMTKKASTSVRSSSFGEAFRTLMAVGPTLAHQYSANTQNKRDQTQREPTAIAADTIVFG